jgi:hypothetical protein
MSSLQSAHRSEGCNIKAAQEGVLVMTREQKIVAIGSAGGVATMIAAVVGIYQIWPHNPSLTDAASRLGYTVQANAFAVIPLLLGILVVANARFLSEAIDPTLQKEDLAMQVNGRVINNTVQQFILFFVATTALCVNASSTQMRLIPAATIVFIIARMAFWIGYRIHPLYRAFGMGATAYLNAGLLAFALCNAAGLGA